jgi:hypothetical protein
VEERLTLTFDTSQPLRAVDQLGRSYDTVVAGMDRGTRRVETGLVRMGGGFEGASRAGIRAMKGLSVGLAGVAGAAAGAERSMVGLGVAVLGAFAAGGPWLAAITAVAAGIGAIVARGKEAKDVLNQIGMEAKKAAADQSKALSESMLSPLGKAQRELEDNLASIASIWEQQSRGRNAQGQPLQDFERQNLEDELFFREKLVGQLYDQVALEQKLVELKRQEAAAAATTQNRALRAGMEGDNAAAVTLADEIGLLADKARAFRDLWEKGGKINQVLHDEVLLIEATLKAKRALLNTVEAIFEAEQKRKTAAFDADVRRLQMDTAGAARLGEIQSAIEYESSTFGSPARIAGLEREAALIEAQIRRERELFELEQKLVELRDPARHGELAGPGGAARIAAFEQATRTQIESTYAGAIQMAQQRAAIAVDPVLNLLKQIEAPLVGGLADMIVDGFVTGFRNAREIALSMVTQMLRQILQNIITSGIQQAFGALFTGGGGGGLGGVVGAVASVVGGVGGGGGPGGAAAGTALAGAATACAGGG